MIGATKGSWLGIYSNATSGVVTAAPAKPLWAITAELVKPGGPIIDVENPSPSLLRIWSSTAEALPKSIGEWTLQETIDATAACS